MPRPEDHIVKKLHERQKAGNYRQLLPESGLIDFCSNDYLGFARSAELKQLIAAEVDKHHQMPNGATGSRLLTGNTRYAEQLEANIAAIHGYPAGLIYNSGYDANTGLLSSLPQRGDTIITDELVHASIIDGARLSHAARYRFKHNDLTSLEEKLMQASGIAYVVIESVYSMDGDTAPLAEVAALTDKYQAHLIVDEAHAVGVFGKGMVNNLQSQRSVFAQIVTFGKALGCHGAIVLGSDLLRQYLINFSRPFIYTTAAPFHQLAAICCAYQFLRETGDLQTTLLNNIEIFKRGFKNQRYQLLPSDSAIQSVVLGNNQVVKDLAKLVQTAGYDARAILSPAVPAGTERLRICLHAFNTVAEIEGLLNVINNFAA